MAKKTLKTIAKKQIKKAIKKKNPLLIIVVIILIAIIGFGGFMYVSENNSYQAYKEDVMAYLDGLDIPSSLDHDLVLSNNEYGVTFTSSDDKLLSNVGKISRPTYTEGDKKVTITASSKYEGKTMLYSILSKFVSYEDISVKYTILIESLPPSDEEICKEISDSIFIPSELYDSMYLATNVYSSDCTLSWSSSNTSVLSNNGSVTNPSIDTIVKLTCTVNYKKASVNKTFEIKVLSDRPIIEYINNDFNSYDDTNKYIDIQEDGYYFKNVKIEADPDFDASKVDATETNTYSNFLKFRYNNEKLNEIVISKTENIKQISFKYKYVDGVKSDTFINVYNSTLSIPIAHYVISHEDKWNDIVIDLTEYSNESFWITFDSDYSTLSYILLDDFVVTRYNNEEDYESSIVVPSNINKSIVLPFTTKYGGKITWTSSKEDVLSSIGEVKNLPETPVTVTLTAKVKVYDKEYTFTYECKVSKQNSNAGEAVMIYFIDLGTTGVSDSGESTYIKYKNIDILVDAGDNFSSTFDGIKSTIDENSEDRVLDYVIATHPDSDHIGSMAKIFEEYQVNNLYKFNGENYTTQKFKNLKAAYDAEPNCNVYDIYTDVVMGSVSEFIYLTSEIYIEFIDTGYYTNAESNGKSIVFVLNMYGTRLLMTGDADSQSAHKTLEVDYMNKVGDIDILKVVHHGTGEGTPIEFLNVTQPEVAIICNGNYLGNKHGHPHPDAISNLIEYFSNSKKTQKIYAITGGGTEASLTSSGAYKGSCTLEDSKIDRNGTIILSVDGNGYTITSSLRGDNLIDITNTKYWNGYLASK